MEEKIEKAYRLAKEAYAKIGVDTDKAIEKLDQVPISIQCWQADDIQGFSRAESRSPGTIPERRGISRS